MTDEEQCSETTTDLDAMLDDALQDYERLEATRPPQPPPPQQQESQQQQQQYKVPQKALFPPNQEDIEATFNAVLASLSKIEPASSSSPQQRQQPQQTAAAPEATTASASQPHPPTAEEMAEDAEATEAVERYIAALAAAGNQPPGSTEAEERSAEAVVQLLRPFVSKEMLYPPLNELRRLFPAWLERQRGVLSEKELAERRQQYECLQRVCQLYESQRTPDAHIQEIVVLVERMGQAPKELVEEASAIAAAAATPSPPPADGQQALPPDCSLM